MTLSKEHKATTSVISNLVVQHVLSNESGNLRTDSVFSALHTLLNGDYVKYSFENTKFSKEWTDKICSDDFQSTLSKINEKTGKRKEKGVYYTPKDVTRYIIANSFLNFSDRSNAKVYNAPDSIDILCKKHKQSLPALLFKTTIFDPTAGAGEFLLSALELKHELVENIFDKTTDKHYLDILSSIYGNDIEIESIEISKIRLFFATLIKLQDNASITVAANILNSNFSCRNFVAPPQKKAKKFDIIVGNPPYVEYGKTTSNPTYGYGNIYADVLHNSSLLLTSNGVMGFIVPLSYTATSRMSKIRDVLNINTPKQFVLNYADRPDCLFVSVHQKLTILLAAKSQTKEIYSSGYKYWYKSERTELLNGRTLVRNNFSNYPIIPKIGNKIELSIFKKVVAHNETESINSWLKKDGASNVFLNMRGCFWVKAFSFNPGSNEYKGFCVDEPAQAYILSLLNSSLFFLLWIITSDCWHITNKELSLFRVATKGVDLEQFKLLNSTLERKLEETKSYIGTKQADYAYKHKECKQEIDLIDDYLQSIYGLTDGELDYVKQFAIRYRMSSGS